MARSNWTVKGRLLLEPQLPEVKALLAPGCETLPLAGVRVLVEAKEFGVDPTWDNWGDDVTNSAGPILDRQGEGRQRPDVPRARHVQGRRTQDISGKQRPDLRRPGEDHDRRRGSGRTSRLPRHRRRRGEAADDVLGWFSRLGYDVDWLTVLEDQPKEDKRKPGPAGTSVPWRPRLRTGQRRRPGRRIRAAPRGALASLAKRAMNFIDGLGGHRLPSRADYRPQASAQHGADRRRDRGLLLRSLQQRGLPGPRTRKATTSSSAPSCTSWCMRGSTSTPSVRPRWRAAHPRWRARIRAA